MAESRKVPADDLFLAAQLVGQGVTSREKVDECLSELLARLDGGVAAPPRLGDVLAEKGYATVQQIQATLHAATVKRDPSGLELAPGHASAYRPDSAFTSRYAIGGEIARGGMGIILDGKDLEIRRELAIKVLIEENAGPEQVARFVEEAQVQGQLEHPNICPVHELGKDAQGRLYFTMKKVKGLSLAQILHTLRRADDPELSRRYSLTRLLEIFSKVCDAVAFAHSRGVIHRDLKPENIMIGEFGEVLVMDWGLAKIVGREDRNRDRLVVSTRAEQGALLSMDGSILGTPAYMPPEQARGKLDEIDERSDVYGLGGILYAILTLRPPIDGTEPLDILRLAQEGRVVPPSQRTPDRTVPPDLEAAAMKALAAERPDRYPTVKALRDDITAFLEGRTLAAAQYSLRQLAAKWYGRNRVFALTASAAALLLLAGGVFYLINVTRARADARSKQALAVAEAGRARAAEADARLQAERALAAEGETKKKREEADAERHKAEVRLAEALVAQGDALSIAGRVAQARDRYTESRTLSTRLGTSTLAADTGLLKLHRQSPPPYLSFPVQKAMIYGASLSPDARRVAAGDLMESNNLTVWEAATGLLIRTLPGHEGGTMAVAFSPDGRSLLSGGHDGTVKLWDAATGTLTRALGSHREDVWGVCFSPDGARAASASKDATVRVWDISSGAEVLTLPGQGANLSHPAFSPDGKLLAAPYGDKAIRLWQIPSGQPLRTLEGHGAYVLAASFSPDATRVVSGGHDNTVRLWDVGSGKELAAMAGHTGFVGSVAFSPDGRTILSASWDHSIKLWDAASRKEISTLGDHKGSILDASFSRDGRYLVSGGTDRVIKIWDGSWRGRPRALSPPNVRVGAFAVSPDGHLLLAVTGGTLEAWDVETGHPLLRFAARPGGASCAAFLPDGRHALAGYGDGTLRVWSLETAAEIRSWKAHSGGVTGLLVSPDGRRLVSAAGDGGVGVWDAAAGTRISSFGAHEGRVSGMSFLPDGNLLTGGMDGRLKVWEPGSGQEVRNLSFGGAITSVSGLPEEGKVLMTQWGEDLHRICLKTGRHENCLKGHTSGVTTLALSADRRLAISGSWDKTVRLWDVEAGSEVRILSEGETPAALNVSPDARHAFLLFEGRLELLRLDFYGWRTDLNRRLSQAGRAPEPRRQTEVSAVLGESYAAAGIHDRAVELLERARSGGVAVPALPLARAYWGAGRPDAARKEFERALTLKEAPEPYLRLCLKALEGK